MNINDILALHFAGERLTDEQENVLVDWVCQNKEEYRRLTEVLQATQGSKQMNFNVEQAWMQVNQELSEHKRFNLYQFRQMLSYAACIAVVCGIALYFLAIDKNNYSEYKNATATLLTIMLPDSSSVTLYPQSRVAYMADAKTNERKTELEGKAFFKVKKNAERPFIVHNNETAIRVLGTSFLVDGESLTETGIFVREGVVQVSSENNKVILKADEQAVSDSSGIVKSRIGNPEAVFKNHIKQKNYKNVLLSQVVKDLEKEFDVQISCEDSIQTFRINTRLVLANLEDILSEISYICNIKYRKIADNKFELYKP